MKEFFKEGGKHVFENLKKKKFLLAFDFDGTLVELKKYPATTALNGPVLDHLKKLSQLFSVAIVSERSVTELRKLLNFEPAYLIGNHGMEGVRSLHNESSLEEQCQKIKIFIMSFLSNKEHLFWVEDKKLSLDLHLQTDRFELELLESLHAIKQSFPDVRFIEGKNVIHVLPVFNIDKGFVLTELMKQYNYEQALFVGDDQSDEDVFRHTQNSILSIRVGYHSLSKAMYYLKSQSEVEPLLQELLLA